MAKYKCQVEIPNVTGLPIDKSVNTWYFKSTQVGTQTQETDDIANALFAFYNGIDELLSDKVTSPARLKIYDHNEAPPRFPIFDENFVIQPGVGASLPNEVAICLSFKAADVSGGNRRRRRGRVYLGPWLASVGNSQTGDQGVDSADRTTIAGAAGSNLLPVLTPQSLSVIEWCVFSRSDALGLAIGAAGPAEEPDYTDAELTLGYHPVVECWVDNAFDTQRRRGVRPTTRTTAT